MIGRRLVTRWGDWWELAVLEPRDRALATLEAWRDRLRQRRERAADRLADGWKLANLDRTAGRGTRSRAAGLSIWWAATLVLCAAGAGVAIAVRGDAADAPAEPARTVPPDQSAARVDTVVRVLAAERREGRLELAASRRGGRQASAAEGIAGAYRASASKLASQAASGRAAPAVTVQALRRAAAAYAALAAAARARDARGFAVARARIRSAESRVRRALRRQT